MNKQNSNDNSLHAERTFIHDISSPLMIATGWLERLARAAPQLAETEEFKRVQSQLERIQALINERRAVLLAIEKEAK